MLFKRTVYIILIFSTILITYTNKIYASNTSIEPDIISASTITLIEQEKIQEIERSIANSATSISSDENIKRSQYLYDKLIQAVRNKQLYTIDYLLNVNFKRSLFMLDHHISGLIGISATRGATEDLTIINKILNAKCQSFLQNMQIGCALQQIEPHKNEMAQLLDKVLAFAASGGHRGIVQYALVQGEGGGIYNVTSMGIDWALQHTMHVTDITNRHQIIADLYQKPSIKPSLSGTIDVLEIALNKGHLKDYENDWLHILELDIKHNGHKVECILKSSTQSIRSALSNKLAGLKQAGKYPPHLESDQGTTLIATQEINADFQNATKPTKKRGRPRKNQN